MTETLYKIPVRFLAEFGNRSGDLGLESFSAADPAKAHRTVQSSRGDTYQAEYPVSGSFKMQGLSFRVSGRIDGVFSNNFPPIIEEIKVAGPDSPRLENRDNAGHWAQAKIYAYLFALEQDYDSLVVQLTYYLPESGKEKSFQVMVSKTELKEYFENLLNKFADFIVELQRWFELRDLFIQSLKFPFSTQRLGQQDLMEQVAAAIDSGHQLMVQAPTGLGKTLAVCFPAIQSLTTENCGKIFYFTARTTGRQAAEQTLLLLQSNGLQLKWITLTAKQKTCFNPGVLCNGTDCEFAAGYYDRLDAALAEASAHTAYTQDRVESIARKYRLCPFEFSLDLSLLADFVICDYNYVFDPRVTLARYFSGYPSPLVTGPYVFLVDEVHNLVDRAREMFSAELIQSDFAHLSKLADDIYSPLAHACEAIRNWYVSKLNELQEAGSTGMEKDAPNSLIPLLDEFREACELFFAKKISFPDQEFLTTLYFDVRKFLSAYELYDQHFASIYQNASGRASVKLFCIDPSRLVSERLKKARAAIFFSATVTPLPYYMKVLGCGPDAQQAEYSTPFPPEHLQLFHLEGLSTRFQQRAQTMHQVAEAIAAVVTSRVGNYFVYFPSYTYMGSVHVLFKQLQPGVKTLLQKTGMSESGRAGFIAEFQSERSETLVGFAVMGGIFGESIDLLGDRLNGAVIIGIGLPAVTQERELIRNYYSEEDRGQEYAYIFPGMTRVLQAMGRVIRSETDRGVILMIDDRYAQEDIQLLLPSYYRMLSVSSLDELESGLDGFWS